MRRMRAALGLALAVAIAGAAAAQPQRYDACLALAETDPRTALEAAAQWIADGGGAAARHCEAAAFANAGAPAQAARLLTTLGAEPGALPETVRAAILLQAADLYRSAGQPEAGEAAATGAVELDPRSVVSLATRAELRAELKDWRGAAADLDRALSLTAPEAGLLTLRAAAKRRSGRLLEARSDALWALELAPDRADAWLELGSAHAALGETDAARRAWIRAIETDTDGSVTPLARHRIQAMEAGG
ncbi:MAG: hypothetical protein AAF713_03275 [Pseudomonadota bacterium]